MNSNSKLGRISSVFIDDEDDKIYVSVVVGPDLEHREIPFVTPSPSMWLVPHEGDIVEIYNTEGKWYAEFAHHSSKQAIPGLDQGDVSLKLDDSTEIRFQKNDSDDYDVTITASGELRLLDSSGHGIVSEGSGSFTWYHDSIDFDSDGEYSWT